MENITDTVTTQEAARMLGICRGAVSMLVTRGLLKPYRYIGRTNLFRVVEVNRYASARRKPGRQKKQQ